MSSILDFLFESLKVITMVAAIVALATTPIAFAVLGRLDWFQARRGRVMMKPSFASIISGMMLVMGIPAIFLALVVKSEHFDKDRYEFDPNKPWSVLEQGRGLKDVKEADEAVKKEMEYLATVKKDLVERVKKLDEAMLTLRSVSGQSPATAQAIPPVLERLAAVRRAIAIDGPQQLMDFTAPPAVLPQQLAGYAAPGGGQPMIVMAAPNGSVPPSAGPVGTAPTAPGAPAPAGLAKAEADAELSTVPAPQRPLASMLPLVEIPTGWALTKYGDKHLETFNADNLFEKIDGRAESFTQNNVVGMAYASYHPIGDDSNEVQVYIFEFDHSKPYRAQGKYTSEKPDKFEPIAIGTEGYTSAGSLLFFVDPYYTQIVSTTDDPKFAAFAVDLAKRISAKQAPESGTTVAGAKKEPTLQERITVLLPSGQGRGTPSFVPQDVFGYSFLSDVFMADYKEGGVTWQGFLRPYASEDEAKATFDKYVDSAKKNGGDPKMIDSPGADQMFVSASLGLVDAIFRKGHVIGGVNGAADAANDEAKAKAAAESFARSFVKSLPADLPKAAPTPPPDKKPDAPAEGDGDKG